MKIIFFTAPLLNHGGGAEKHFIAMGNEMAKRGHKVSIINLNKDFYQKISFLLTLYYRSNQVNEFRYSDEEVLKSLRKGVNWLAVNFKNLKKELIKSDVIYTKNEILDLFLLKMIKVSDEVPIIIGIHTPVYYPIDNSFQAKIHNFLYLSRFYKWLIKEASNIRVLNSDDEKLFKKRFAINKERLFKISNPIDTKFFSPKKRNEGQKKFKIIFVGRLNQQKGVDFLCELIKELSRFYKNIFKNIIFSIVGTGDSENLIKELCKRFKNVIFFGQVSQKELPFLYSQNDILVAPSRYETMHWVSLESQSCGLPVIATNIPGPREIIKNNKTGFLINFNKKIFIKKIIFFYNLKKESPKLFNRFILESRKNIINKFGYKSICDKLENLLLKTMNKNEK